MNESKFTCNVCGESEFTTKEGFYYCNECGTQSKRRDIVFETEEIPSTLYQSKIKIQTLKTEKPQLTSWECFNYLLRGLVEELLELGAKEDLKKVTLQLWAHYLRLSEAAFFNKKQTELPKLGPRFSLRDAKILYNQLNSKRKTRKQVGESGKREIQKQKRQFMEKEYEKLSQPSYHSSTTLTSSTSQGSSTRAIRLSFSRSARKYYKTKMNRSHLKKHEIDEKSELKCHQLHKAPKLNKNIASAHLSRQTVYTILYIALNLIQDDIQLCDILRFMREGHLSSTQIMHFFPEEIALNCEELIKSKIFYSRRDIFLDMSMRIHTSFLCRLLHINELQTPNLQNLINRYVDDLNLPSQITIYINRLINLCPIQKIPLKLEHRISPFYEARAMAFIIFILKLLFGLDDHKEIQISKSAKIINNEIEKNGIKDHKKIFVWDEWVKFIETRKIILSQCHLPTAIQFKLNLNEDQYLDQYNFNNDDNNLIDSKKLSTNSKTKIHNMQSIFDSFQMKNRNNDSLKINSMKFAPSLTPNHSYFAEILRIKPENLNIPKFMKIDHSKYDIECYVKAKQLKSTFISKNIQLKINKLSCKSERNYVGLFKVFLENRKNRDIKARKIDFNIDEDKWFNNIYKNDDKVNIIQSSKKKAKSQPIHLIRKQQKLNDISLPTDNKQNENNIEDKSSIRSFDIFNETDMNPYDEKYFKEPRRNLEQDNIFADLSDNDDDDDGEDEDDVQKNYKKLLELNVSNFDYWIIFGKYVNLMDKYGNQIKSQFPKSFLWLLETCSNLLDIDWDYLYRELIIIENYFANVLESFENVTNTLRFQTECKNKDLEKTFQDYKNLW